MSVLRDLLDLPPEVTKSAFVIRLVEAVTRPDWLMDTYAITPDIHHALDAGLSIVNAALRERRNTAAFVHGSFGSGKSHLMGALSLLLANHPRAWSEPALHDLLAKHEWVRSRKVLRFHLNMIDAPGLAEKLFSAYVREMRELHPAAPVPPLYADQALFENAQGLRREIGDALFFEKLNAGAAGADGRWGKKKTAAAWTAERFDEACQSADEKVRGQLFSALVKSLFPAFAEQQSAFVPFEQGLGALSRHAAEQGYDGVVFFLDELILWLATKAANAEKLNDEIAKLAKLVEGQAAGQAIPLVTFAARQRDPAEMVGEQHTGAATQAVRDKLAFWEGRFDKIRLEDRNLPAIVEKRVVRSRDDAARRTLDDAFARMRRSLGTAAWGTLLGEQGDEAAFRKVYPFSPAMVEALVAMSHYLQRERTALKLLVEMLVEHLEDFEIGKLVPIGDLYDALAGAEDPMDGTMRERFAAARRLYTSELLPLIQQQNGTASKERCQRLRDDHPVTLGCSNCRETRCRNDNRLAKTLLIAALIPNNAIFRNLTASRLVQLNHGTLKSPVPGEEKSLAVSRLRSWGAEIGKVRVEGQPEDPSVRVVLGRVNLRPILESAMHYDNPGAQRAKCRELLFDALGLSGTKATVEHSALWRGTERRGVIHFGNVREMDDVTLRVEREGDFKVVIDYPFDDPGRTPQEDEQRLAAYRATGVDTLTVVWLPSFLAETPHRDLRDLVIIDRILEADNWKMHLMNLRPEEQKEAHDELGSLAAQKRERVKRALDAAYGFQKAEAGMLDPTRSVGQHFHVLMRDYKIRGLTAATLKQGLAAVVEELYTERYARHPEFSDKVTRGKLDGELRLLQALVESDQGRTVLGKGERNALRFADELGLVSAREGQVSLLQQRFDEIDRALRLRGIETPDVAQVKAAIDPEDVMGLLPEVADFVVLAYALVRRRELSRGGQAVKEPALGKLDRDIELLRPRLPDAGPWHKALDRAGALFGIALGGRACNAKNLRELSARLEERRKESINDGATRVAQLLVDRERFFAEGAPRLRTAVRVLELLEGLAPPDPLLRVRVLADLVPETSETAMERHLKSARAVVDVLSDGLVFESFRALGGRPEPAAAALLASVREALGADEIHTALAPRLRELALEAQQILHGKDDDEEELASRPPLPPVEVAPRPIGARPPVVVAEGSTAAIRSVEAVDEAARRMREALEQAGTGAELQIAWRVTRRP